MKLWRKQAMKAGKGTGRRIRAAARMQEIEGHGLVKVYPLLDQMLIRAGAVNEQYRADQNTIRAMIAKLRADKESVNEVE